MSLVDGRFRKHLAVEVPLTPAQSLSSIDQAIFDASAQIEHALDVLIAQEAERESLGADSVGEDVPWAFLRGALSLLAGAHYSIDFLEVFHRRLSEKEAPQTRPTYRPGPESLEPVQAAS